MYTYYTDGNQRTKYDSTRSITTTYTYDGAGRLLTEIEILGGNLYQSYAYTYDHAGNRLTLTAEGTSELYTEYTYNAANQLTVEEATVGEDTTVIEYAYDVRGCLLTKTTDSVVTDTYAFDERARLIVYTGSEGSFVYYNLPDNRRYTKKYGPSSDDRIRYIFDGDILIYEGEFTAMRIGTIYVHGLNLISSKYRTINSESSPMQLIAFYVQNAHGDVVQLLDPTDNTVTKSYIYDAFGNELDPSSTDTNYFRYCGEYYDTERGEYYLRARYYDPRTGRFTQEDPIWSGLNWYTYCYGNPVAFVDPFGLERIVVSGGSSGAEKFRYNFIETAIKQIKDWQDISDESIAWVIANWNYSEQDLINFQTVADSYGVNLLIISDKQELFDYINKQGRADDLISAMSFFAHGTAFDAGHPNPGYENKYAVALGYSGLEDLDHDNNLNIFVSDIALINSSAFVADNYTFFGTCRTANKFGGVSFAQEWANMTNGIAKAAVGKTTYSKIFPVNILVRAINKFGFGIETQREILRERYGFSSLGCLNYPTPVFLASWRTFNPN